MITRLKEDLYPSQLYLLLNYIVLFKILYLTLKEYSQSKEYENFIREKYYI